MKKCIVASVLVLNRRGDRVLLINHKKLGVWLYPGGHIEQGENPLEAGLREVKEETGLNVNVVDYFGKALNHDGHSRRSPQPMAIYLEDVPYKDGRHEHFDIVYLALANKYMLKFNEKETSGMRWFKEEEVDRLKTYGNMRRVIHEGFKLCKGRPPAGKG